MAVAKVKRSGKFAAIEAVPARPMRRVAMVVDTGGSYGRGLLRGVLRYVEMHGPWNLYLEVSSAIRPEGLERWSGDGILARVRGPELAAVIARMDLPTVVLSPMDAPPGAKHPPVIAAAPDRAGDARLALEHLREKGFRRVLFVCAPGGMDMGRYAPCVEHARAMDIEFSVVGHDEPRGAPWAVRLENLTRWLREIPKPAGVVAANDYTGYEILQVAREIGIHVPTELAVIGSDDDELLCRACWPPLSSIQIATEQIGYYSAAVLDDLMSGREPRQREVLLPPLGVVQRGSTSVLAVEDADLAEAIRYIHEHATQGICVEDVLRAVPIARRTFERRCHAATGMNPQELIRHEQLRHATRLLLDTDLAMPAIAERCGFANAPRFTEAFTRVYHKPPTAYRREHRPVA
jgi:LacI family transcriptional regulator